MIAVTPLGPEIFLTAVVTHEGTLKNIAWHIAPDGVVARLGDSGEQAGQTDFIDIAALDPSRFVSAVRTASGRLKLIAWSFGSVGEKAMAEVDGTRLALSGAVPDVSEDLDDFAEIADGMKPDQSADVTRATREPARVSE